MFRQRGFAKVLMVALLSTFVIPISVPEVAQATNPLCSPTLRVNPQNLNQRVYAFTTPGTCDWVLTSVVSVAQVAVISGGGGGGGGSFGGALGGGGGGGGGGGYEKTNLWRLFEPGTTITVTVGAGGSAGVGASTINSTGTPGGTGGTSSFNGFEVVGGSGGLGGAIDVGGAGGTAGHLPGNNVVRSAGISTDGNGGGGSTTTAYGQNATSSTAGGRSSGSAINDSIFYHPEATDVGTGGAGGAAGSNTSVGGATNAQGPSAAPAAGGGGNGGHGCPSSQSPCNYRDGSAGSNGLILVSTFHQLQVGEYGNNIGVDANGTWRATVGRYYSYKPFFNPAPIGSGSWSISPALPSGLSFNTTNGVISGSISEYQLQTIYTVSFTDSVGTTSRSLYFYGIRANQSLSISDRTLKFGSTYTIPISELQGSGALSISTSQSANCALSGPSNSVVTALKSSGTCTISVAKAVSNSYFSYSGSFVITLAKATPALTLTSNLSSPQVSGTTIGLSVSVSGVSTGSVDFYNGDTLLTQCGTNGRVNVVSATATCNWIPPNSAGGAYEISAKYVESTNYASTTSNVLSYQIHPAIVLSYPSSESTYGNSATVTPSISGGTGSVTSWTWSVAQTSNQQAVSGISINSSGVITISSSASAGTYAMTVNAQDTVGITKSATLSIKVNAANPVLRLTRPSKSAYSKGQQIQLSATLPSDATGTIAFKYGSTTITSCGSAGNVTVSSGSATCTWNTSGVAHGSYDITAAYSGGGSYNAATSFGYQVIINQRAQFRYQNQSTTYKVGTTLAPEITANTGTGAATDWSWSVVNNSDSQTVSGITISISGVISVDDSVGAGNYSLGISAVDLAGDTVTAQVELTINKATPIITLSPRLITNAVVTEATANRQIAWTIQSTHFSSGSVRMFVNGSDINCSTQIAFSNGQCWWQSSTSGITVSAYATFAGDSNIESATSNVITNFPINPALSLTYSDTSTYVGFETTLTPTWSGGTGTKLFTMSQHVTGDQIPGITIDSSTGVISVDRTTATGVYRMVLAVYDVTGASALDDNVQISVLSHVAPSISLSSSSQSLEIDEAIQEYEIINAATPGVFFTISPSLPTGFLFDPGNGKIYGSSSTALSARNYTITAINIAGSDTATLTLTVTEPLNATISISLGTSPAAKGVANTIVATFSTAGKVQFFIDKKRVAGCVSVRGTTSATCNWKPSRIGAFSLSARLTPTNNSIPVANSNILNVGVGRRTGLR